MGSFKRSLPYAFSFAAAVFMVMAAELIGDNEIIFPEITAVAIGALAAPKRAWNTSRLRLFLTISAAAFLGVGIVRFVPLPLVFQVPLGLVCVLTLVTLSGTEFIPAVSACVLPILMGTESVVYIISVAVMVGMILLMQVILEKLGVREKYDFHPVEISRRLLKLRIKQAVIASLLCALPAIFHEPFFFAPPLIVAFIELSKPKSKLRTKSNAFKAVLLVIAAAFLGAGARLLIVETAGLPLTLAAAVSCGVILFAVYKAGLFFPPCGAVATLPLIIPSAAVIKFPFEVTAGILVFTAAAFILFKEN